MDGNDNLRAFFKTLADILPYEYGEYLIKNTGYIAITKENSTIVVYVEEDETEPGVLDAASYDTEDDELSPYTTTRFDIMASDFNVLDAVDEIKRLF